MMDKPRVSVIIPVYNVEKYIEECARSLFEQTLDSIEYIFIDDCSPDNSVTLLNDLLKHYPGRANQTRIIHLAENKGQAEVRKIGLSNVSGEYVTFCDSDDWVDVTAYQKMYDAAITSSADLVICDIVNEECGSSSPMVSCHSTERKSFILNCLYGTDPWSCCNKLFKREAITDIKYFPSGNYGEDMVISLQAVCNCRTLSYVPEGLYHYRINPASISNLLTDTRRMTNFRQCCENIDMLESFFEESNMKDDVARGLDHIKMNIKFYLDTFDAEDKALLWKTAYPNVELRAAFLDPVLSFKNRVKCLLRTIGIFR